MIEIANFLTVAAAVGIGTWALLDIYFDSILFLGWRSLGQRLQNQYKSGIRNKLGYLLNCPYCLSHWFAFAITVLFWLVGFFDHKWCAVFTVPLLAVIGARVSNMLRDYVYPPITATNLQDSYPADYDQEEPNPAETAKEATDERTAAAQSQQSDRPRS
jgi:hypothetical protein